MPEGWKPVPDQTGTARIVFELEDMVPENFRVTGNPFWSNRGAMRWTPEREGDELPLTFESPGKGIYQLRASLVHTPDSGRVRFKINGCDIANPHARPGSPIVKDLHTPYQTRMIDTRLSHVELGEGPQTLTIISEGKSPESKGLVIGGDYMLLTRTK
jgi:hypothetical protein